MKAVACAVTLLQLCGVADGRWVYTHNPLTTHPKAARTFPWVNALTSIDGIIPYAPYDLKFCPPDDNPLYQGQDPPDPDLGAALRGDSLHFSNYEFKMLEDEKCKKLAPCTDEQRTLRQDDIQKFKDFIIEGYRANMILDYLPALIKDRDAQRPCEAGRNPERFARAIKGYLVGGCKMEPSENEASKFFLNNHLEFTIKYNEHTMDDGSTQYYINGFFVQTRSYSEANCAGGDLFLEGNEMKVDWTYDVKWELDKTVDWPTRWDYYLASSEADTNAREHWLRLTQAVLIILCLAAIVGIILARTLHLDFNRYNNPENDEEMQEEVGWKLVHSEVFRPPEWPNVFAGFIGTGVQLGGMATVACLFGFLGLLSPGKRGVFIMYILFLFFLMAFLNGLVTGLIQMMFGTRQWKFVILSACAFPSVCFFFWTVMELSLNAGASNAVEAKTVFVLILLWFGVCIPMAVLGASFAYRLPVIENPLRYNNLKRNIPPQRCLFKPLSTVLLPGIIPFAAANWELMLILRAVWQGQVYYVFGFLSVMFFAVAVCVVLTVITYIYYQLVYEDYRWWWKSVMVPSGLSVYYFLRCVVYYYGKLRVKTWLGAWVFFSFSIVTSLAMFIVFGSIGFFSAWMFTRKIYASIKIE